jgi:hypothetical protein
MFSSLRFSIESLEKSFCTLIISLKVLDFSLEKMFRKLFKNKFYKRFYVYFRDGDRSLDSIQRYEKKVFPIDCQNFFKFKIRYFFRKIFKNRELLTKKPSNNLIESNYIY